MKKDSLKKIGKFIPIIGVILFIYIIIDIGAEKIFNTFTQIPIHYYIIGFLPFFIRMFFFTYKWQYICKKQKMNFRFFYLMKIFLMSMLYGSVTPGGLGWHIRVIYLRKKSNASIEKCLANSLLDTSLAVITGMFISVIGAFFFIDVFSGLFPVFLGFFIFNLVAIIIFLKKSGGGKILRFFVRLLIPGKYKEKINKSVESLYEDIPRLRDLFIPFLFILGLWTLSGLQVFIIAQAFPIEMPSLATFILINAMAVTLTSIIPISVGGLGIREGAFVFLLSSFGVDASIAFVISIGGFLVKTIFPSLIGMVISFRKTIK